LTEPSRSSLLDPQAIKIAEQKELLNVGWAEYQARYEENDRVRRAQLEARRSIQSDIPAHAKRASAGEQHAASRLQLDEAELAVRCTARKFAELRLGSATRGALEEVQEHAGSEEDEAVEASEVSLHRGKLVQEDGAVNLISRSDDGKQREPLHEVILLSSDDDDDVVPPPAIETSPSASTAESDEADAGLQGPDWLRSDCWPDLPALQLAVM
jgi:hypothetical protein